LAKDRIRPMKLESPATGGTQDDAFPTEVNPNEDYPDVRGVTFQNDSSNDEVVYVERDASGNMVFADDVVSGEKTLNDLLTAGDDDDQVKVVIEIGVTFTVKEDHQHIFYDELVVDGEYVVDGESVGFGGNDVQAVDLFDETGGTNVVSGWTDIALDVEGKKTGSFTHETSSAEVMINRKGTYLVAARAGTTISSGTSRSDSEMRLMRDSGSGYSEIAGTRSLMYNRTADTGRSSGSITRTLDLLAGDKLKVQVRRLSGSSTVETYPEATGLTILRCG